MNVKAPALNAAKANDQKYCALSSNCRGNMRERTVADSEVCGGLGLKVDDFDCDPFWRPPQSKGWSMRQDMSSLERMVRINAYTTGPN